MWNIVCEVNELMRGVDALDVRNYEGFVLHLGWIQPYARMGRTGSESSAALMQAVP